VAGLAAGVLDALRLPTTASAREIDHRQHPGWVLTIGRDRRPAAGRPADQEHALARDAAVLAEKSERRLDILGRRQAGLVEIGVAAGPVGFEPRTAGLPVAATQR